MYNTLDHGQHKKKQPKMTTKTKWHNFKFKNLWLSIRPNQNQNQISIFSRKIVAINQTKPNEEANEVEEIFPIFSFDGNESFGEYIRTAIHTIHMQI